MVWPFEYLYIECCSCMINFNKTTSLAYSMQSTSNQNDLLGLQHAESTSNQHSYLRCMTTTVYSMQSTSNQHSYLRCTTTTVYSMQSTSNQHSYLRCTTTTVYMIITFTYALRCGIRGEKNKPQIYQPCIINVVNWQYFEPPDWSTTNYG